MQHAQWGHPIVHEEPEAEVVSDESDSVETDIENIASEVEDINASTNTEKKQSATCCNFLANYLVEYNCVFFLQKNCNISPYLCTIGM